MPGVRLGRIQRAQLDVALAGFQALVSHDVHQVKDITAAPEQFHARRMPEDMRARLGRLNT